MEEKFAIYKILAFSFSLNWAKTDIILIISRTHFPLDLTPRSNKGKEGLPGNPPKCSSSSDQQWLGGLHVPYCSQVRENLGNKKVLKKKDIWSICLWTLPYSLQWRKEFCSQPYVAETRGEKGGLKVCQADVTPHPLRGYLNLLSLLELMSPAVTSWRQDMCSGARRRLWLHTQKVHEV